MELLARGNSNWDYYYDEERNVIYYFSKKSHLTKKDIDTFNVK